MRQRPVGAVDEGDERPREVLIGAEVRQHRRVAAEQLGEIGETDEERGEGGE